MRTIVAASLRFRFLIVALAGALMFVGVGQVKKMPVDVFPEFAPPKVEIQTLGIGLAPADIENLITVPMEEVLAGTPGLDVMRSRSVNDLSQIRLIFERDTDIMHARQLVQERMDLVAPNLPTWAAPPVMLQPLSATSRAMKIGIRSDKPQHDAAVDDRLLDDQAAAPAGPRRGQRPDLGRADPDALGPGRPGEDGGPRTSRSTRS